MHFGQVKSLFGTYSLLYEWRVTIAQRIDKLRNKLAWLDRSA